MRRGSIVAIAGVAVVLGGCGESSKNADVLDEPSATATTVSAEPTPTGSASASATTSGEPAPDGTTKPSAGPSVTSNPAPTIVDLAPTGPWAAWSGVSAAIASVSKDGTATSAFNEQPVVSGNGRFVAFRTKGSELGCPDGVVVKELATGDVECASTTSAGEPALTSGSDAAYSDFPALSADGRTVAFASNAANLVPRKSGDPDGEQVFVKNLDTGTLRVASATSDGTLVYTTFLDVQISGDARTVAFRSASAKLVPNDANRVIDVFVKNLDSGSMVQASRKPGGGAGATAAETFDLSADGKHVAFTAAYEAQSSDVYLTDLTAKKTTLLSPGAGAIAEAPSISADGGRVVFVLYGKKHADPRKVVLAETGADKQRNLAVPGSDVPTFRIGRVAISGDGATVAYGTGEGRQSPIVLVEVATGKRSAIADAKAAVTAQSLSQTGGVLTALGYTNNVKYWSRR